MAAAFIKLCFRYFMTDRTENNRVFNSTKILTTVALVLIFNYAFVIGYTWLTVLLEFPGGITKCAGLQFEENRSILVKIPLYFCYLVLTISGIFADIALQRYILS